jgi:hypothetical protein
MSDANYASIGWAREEEWGTDPASPSLTALRFTAEDLSHSKDTQRSDELRSDRQRADLVEVGVEGGGSVSFELSYTWAEFLISALMTRHKPAAVTGLAGVDFDATDDTLTGTTGDFSAYQAGDRITIAGATTPANNGTFRVASVNSDGSVLTLATGAVDTTETNTIDITVTDIVARAPSADISGQTITDAAATFSDIKKGGWIKIAGASTSGNNGLKRVLDVNSDGSVLTLYAGSLTGSDTGEDLTITTQDYRIGTTPTSYVLERNILAQDGNHYYQKHNGMQPASVALTIAAGEKITGSMDFMGKGATPSSSTIDADGTYTPAGTAPIMNGTSNVGSVYKDGAALSAEIIGSLDFTLENNLRAIKGIGDRFTKRVGVGGADLTGNFELYFANNAQYTSFIDHDSVSLSFSVTDTDGNTIAFTIPKMKLADANPPIGGIDTDITQNVEFQAMHDPTTLAQFIVNVFPA